MAKRRDACRAGTHAAWPFPASRTSRSPTASAGGTATPPRSGSASSPDAEDEPNARHRDAHVWYDADKKDNFTAYKLLIADVVDGRLMAVPRGVMAAGGIMQGARGGVDGCRAERRRPGSRPPREVLHEDGRHAALGGLTSRAA